MGKGSKSPPPQPTSQTITQTTLPEYAQPFFTDLLQRGQAESRRGYENYPGERISGFDPMQIQAQTAAGNLTLPGQVGSATNMATDSGLGALTPGSFGYAQSGGVGSFTDPGVASQYMSPYISEVLERQKFEANRNAQQADLAQDLGAARQGSYGGSRQLLASLERERNLERQMGDIDAQGLQSAYDRGQSTFEQEQARRLQAGLTTQGLAEESRLQGYGLGIQGAKTLGDLGGLTNDINLQQIQAQAAAGQERQGLDQQRLDTAYGDFLRQRDYPRENLQFYSSLLQGVPTPSSSSQIAYSQPPSMAAQAGGLGLAGLGLYNMFDK